MGNRNDRVVLIFGLGAFTLSLFEFFGPICFIMYILSYAFPYLAAKLFAPNRNLTGMTLLLSFSYLSIVAFISIARYHSM